MIPRFSSAWLLIALQILAPRFALAAKNTDREVPVIKMTEEELADLIRNRQRFDNSRGYGNGRSMEPLTKDQLRSSEPTVCIKLPTRNAFFGGRSVHIDLAADWEPIVAGFAYFPETTQVLVDYHSVTFPHGEGAFEATPVPIALLQGLLRLPALNEFQISEGTLSTESMALIGKHPSLRKLVLGHCRISSESFSQLSASKTLEMLGVVSGVTPECFITLAKLPRFRCFEIYGSPYAFNVPITIETRRAIESLDGRLETFYVEEYEEILHPDFVRALLKVKSLKQLRIDSVAPGLTLADLEQLEGLINLEQLSFPNGGTYFGKNQATADAIVRRVEVQIAQRASARQQPTK